MTVGLHLCRGNFKGGVHFSTGSYDAIATKLFTRINVDAYYLEYDTPRAGGFEPLSYLPTNKTIVLGLISSKVPELEDIETLKARFWSAARYIAKGDKLRKAGVPVDEDTLKQEQEGEITQEDLREAARRMCVSPQCGFASHSEGNNLDEGDMRRKLQLAVGLAGEIWPGEV